MNRRKEVESRTVKRFTTHTLLLVCHRRKSSKYRLTPFHHLSLFGHWFVIFNTFHDVSFSCLIILFSLSHSLLLDKIRPSSVFRRKLFLCKLDSGVSIFSSNDEISPVFTPFRDNVIQSVRFFYLLNLKIVLTLLLSQFLSSLSFSLFIFPK